mgnify:FL=1|jgi:hypothetical protein
MHQIKHTPPEAMTPQQRRQEVAGLLANGLVRLRTASLSAATAQPQESQFDLGFTGDQRVHADLVNNVVRKPR